MKQIIRFTVILKLLKHKNYKLYHTDQFKQKKKEMKMTIFISVADLSLAVIT